MTLFRKSWFHAALLVGFFGGCDSTPAPVNEPTVLPAAKAIPVSKKKGAVKSIKSAIQGPAAPVAPSAPEAPK